jgi:UDP-N-acetylmuramate dehydrogenase
MGVANPGIREVSEAVIRIRRSKLPDPAVIGNAGSFFKNPEVPEAVYHSLKASYPDLPGYNAGPGRIKLAAGYLIEKCGWKGKVVGHVGMHEKQALVLVNHGGATGSELIEHARRVQTSVMDTFGVELEMEVNIL